MVGETIGQYKILEKLGEGGMGVVYKAEDAELKRTVALKFLSPHALVGDEGLSRFINEAQAAAGINHPNICTIYEIKRTEEHTFIAMSYVEGRTLKELLGSGPMEARHGLDVALQVAEGLREAHSKGIIHRDIKPANIMITPTGRAVIMDFGVAKVPGGVDLTKVGASLGTVGYMSPEQARGEPVDIRTDLWSLGAILYEMTSGERPFKGDYEPAVVYSVLNESPKPVPGMPAELERIIFKALTKTVEGRYQNCDEMMKDMEALSRRLDPGSMGLPAGSGRERRKQVSKRYLEITAFIILLIAAAVLLTQTLIRDDDNETEGLEGGSANRGHEAIKLTQVTFSEDLEECPAFSPDGEKIAYCHKTAGFMHIFIKHLGTGDEVQITEGDFDDIQPAWSPTGDAVLFVRSNQPGGRMEPSDVFGPFDSGDVWRIDLESGRELKLMDNAFNPQCSPDGEHIAVDASWAGPRRIWITDAMGRNPLQVTDDPSEAVAHILPSWSPDGSRMVFQNLEKTKYDIKVVEVATRRMNWITNDLYTDINPVWSRSGREIFFSSYRGGGMNIWRVNVTPDGSAVGSPIQMTTGPGQDVQLHASVDGRLAFSILKINADIWRLPVSPSTGQPTGASMPVIETTREDSRGAWSPDGGRIAFNSDRTGDMNLWVYSFADDSVSQVTVGSGGDYQANWSPDGGGLVFFSTRSGNADIWAVDIKSRELEQLTKDPALDFNPFFSPDGKHIAFQSDRHGRRELWIMGADGTNQRQLTETGIGGHFMRWTLDGTAVIYAPSGMDPWLYRVSLGGESQPYTEFSGRSHISFSPDQSLGMDVVGHKVLWTTSIESGDGRPVFEFEDADIRLDYPVWSPDGRWLLFDRLKPQGGDIWIIDGAGQ